MCGFSIILILKKIMTFQSQRVHAVCAIQLNKSLIINIAWLDLLIITAWFKMTLSVLYKQAFLRKKPHMLNLAVFFYLSETTFYKKSSLSKHKQIDKKCSSLAVKFDINSVTKCEPFRI